MGISDISRRTFAYFLFKRMLTPLAHVKPSGGILSEIWIHPRPKTQDPRPYGLRVPKTQDSGPGSVYPGPCVTFEVIDTNLVNS